MELCSTPLAVGMTMADFIEKVSPECEAIKSVNDTWVLKQKGPNGKPEGLVEFSSGRISEVRRSWVPSDGRYGAADYARGFVSAVESALQGREHATAVVSYSIDHQPGSTVYRATLSLPDHREVTVALVEDPAKSPENRVLMLDVEESVVK
jgi:hypothetical protein